jgi:hypothetical protein
MDILLRVLLLLGGFGIAVAFAGFGLFFLGWVFSQHGNGW